MSEESSVATISQPIASHPSIEEAIRIYAESDGDIDKVDAFFNEIKNPYPKNDIEIFFKPIDIKKKKYEILLENAYGALRKKTVEDSKEAALRIEMVQQITWSRIFDIYMDGLEERPKTKEARNMHKDQSKEFCELAKTYKDLHEMKLKILGMGKTEEEAKAEVESYFAGMMKKVVNALDDMPDAQRKIQELLGFIPKSSEGD